MDPNDESLKRAEILKGEIKSVFADFQAVPSPSIELQRKLEDLLLSLNTDANQAWVRKQGESIVAALKKTEEQKLALVNPADGQRLTEYAYGEIGIHECNGLIRIRKDSDMANARGSYGYINQEGKEIVPPTDYSDVNRFYDGAKIISANNGHFYNQSGQEITPIFQNGIEEASLTYWNVLRVDELTDQQGRNKTIITHFYNSDGVQILEALNVLGVETLQVSHKITFNYNQYSDNSRITTKLTDVFPESFSFDAKILIQTQDGKFGVIDCEAGKVLVPVELGSKAEALKQLTDLEGDKL